MAAVGTTRIAFPHQAEALRWGREKKCLGLLHEMRLGKSLVATRWLKEKREAESVLVVAPLSVLPVWEEELAAEGVDSVLLLGSPDQRLRLAQQARGRWCLMNWEGLIVPGQRTAGGKRKAIPSPAASLSWDAVLLDESTRIKNPSALVSKVCCSVFSDAEFRAILSGLPNPSSSLDFFQQMKFLFGEFMGCDSYWRFRDTYFNSDYMGWSWNPRPGAAKKIRDEVHRCCSVLTRKDVGLANEKIWECRYVDLPGRVRREYLRAEKDFEVGDEFTKWKLVSRLWCEQLCGGRPKHMPQFDHDAKIDELRDLLGGDLTGQQVLVWCRYRREIRAVERALRKDGIKVRTLHGGTPVAMRKDYAASIRDGSLQVLVLQYNAGRYGLNLSRCSAAIYFSLTDDPESFAQSQDRLEHPMKKEPLLYLVLLAKDTLDEDRYAALKKKRRQSDTYLRAVWESMQKRLKARRAV